MNLLLIISIILICMQTLNTEIDTIIKSSFEKLSKAFAKNFNIPVKDVISFWKELNAGCQDKKVEKVKDREETIEETNDKEKSNKKEKKKNIYKTGCIHVFERGPRKFNECGDKISKQSQTGEYCGKHLVHEKKH